MSGRVVPEIGDVHLREVFLQSYRIIYRVTGNRVEIVTVHDGARLLEAGEASGVE